MVCVAVLVEARAVRGEPGVVVVVAELPADEARAEADAGLRLALSARLAQRVDQESGDTGNDKNERDGKTIQTSGGAFCVVFGKLNSKSCENKQLLGGPTDRPTDRPTKQSSRAER